MAARDLLFARSSSFHSPAGGGESLLMKWFVFSIAEANHPLFRSKTMTTAPELSVTLSDELLKHLRAESSRLKVALEWLVAGLVVDTLDDDLPKRQRLAASA